MPKDDIRLLSERLIIPPASYRIVGPDADTPGAQEVVNQQADTINAFVQRHRDQVHLSGLPQHRANFTSDAIDITYHHAFGQERIELRPYVVPTSLELPPAVELTFEVPDVDVPVIVDVIPQFGKFLMVLYKGNRVAAISMADLANVQKGLVVSYDGDLAGISFAQPVKTGQYTFNGLGFIQTDLDLSGQHLKKSVICSTYVFDAFSLAKQSIPLMNSMAGTAATSGMLDVTIFTSSASVLYSKGKFSFGTVNVNTEQCCAIDQNGTLYYGASFEAPQCALVMNDSDVDDAVEANGLAAAEATISTWVTAYTVNYLYWVESHENESFTGYVVIGPDPPRGSSLSNTTDYGFYSDTIHSDIHLHVVSTVVPSGDPPSGPHANMDNITEVVGAGYYASSTYDAKMALQMVKLSWDNVYYYSYVFTDNYYEYTTNPGSSADFSGTFYRMAYVGKGQVQIQGDPVVASGVNTYTVVLSSTQDFPDFGGSLITGLTGSSNAPTTATPTNPLTLFGQNVGSSMVDQVVCHTTVTPNPGPIGGYINLSYATVEGLVQNILQQLDGPLTDSTGAVLPNTTPGPSGTYGGSSDSDTTVNYIFDTTRLQGDGSNTYFSSTIPNSSSSTSPVDRAPPGYKAQIVNSIYKASIKWTGVGIAAAADSTKPDQDTATEIAVEPFPPGSMDVAFYTLTTQVGANDPVTQFVTPFVTIKAPTSQSQMNGWLHISNPTHYIQGWLIDQTPYLYLDGKDFMPALTDALNCTPTDIAALYMDIDLDTIMTLAPTID